MADMAEYETIKINGKGFPVRTKRINQADLTADCWFVQIWGLPYCSGFGEPENRCEYLGTEACGGHKIRQMILSGKYPLHGIPNAKSRGES